MDVDMQPAELVRSLRLRAGITQRQLAIRAGTTKTAISRLEGGHVSPTFRTLEKVLLCMGYVPELSAARLTPKMDAAELEAVRHLTPTERLERAFPTLLNPAK